MINSQTEKPRFFATVGRQCSKFFLNRYFYLLLFCAACIVSVLDWEVGGAIAFVSLICLILVLCDDILAAALPFALLCTFVTVCYDSASTFIKFWWMAIPAAAAIIFHFVVYRQKLALGSSIWGLIAVSAAVSLGGVGVISAKDYFSPAAIYYTVFLGIGMVGLYLLLKSQLSARRSYDVRERLVLILYVTGIFAAFVVLLNVLPETRFFGGFKIYEGLQAQNNLSTILAFALPCPFFFARENKLHLIPALLLSASMVLSGSRAGLLLGVAELLICIIVSAIWDKKNRFFYICAIVGAASVALLFKQRIFDILGNAGIYPVVSDNEPRMRLIWRSIEAFKEYPLFGHGLAYTGNFDIYKPVSGAMGWYHMMIPQIIASMGIVGIAAYIFQAVLQTRIVLRSMKGTLVRERSVIITLALSYLGVLLMSQVNPGVFCPVPYGLMATIIFAVLDGDDGMEWTASLLDKLPAKENTTKENTTKED